jgi:hypothetical protein
MVISRSASEEEENLIDAWNGTVGGTRPGGWTEYVDDGSLSGLDGPGEETFSSITVVGRPTQRIRHAEIRWWSQLKFPLPDLADLITAPTQERDGNDTGRPVVELLTSKCTAAMATTKKFRAGRFRRRPNRLPLKRFPTRCKK